MPRSGWLAIGSVLAALAGPAAVERLGVGGGSAPGRRLALVVATIGLAGSRSRATRLQARPAPARRSRRARSRSRSGCCSSGPPVAEPSIPLGDGPWTADVVGVGSPRDGQQSATLRARRPGDTRVAATLPRYPEIAPGERVATSGRLEPLPADDGGYGTYLRRIGVAATLRGAVARPARERRVGRRRRREPAAVVRRGTDPRPARAGGGPGCRDPHRSPRPGRSRPRRRVHDRRGQPRRRDLRLEHRDRRGPGRRVSSVAGSADAAGRS